MKPKFLIIAFAACVSGAGTAQAQTDIVQRVDDTGFDILIPLEPDIKLLFLDETKNRKPYVPRWGVDLGSFRFSSERTRSLFGSNALSFSPGFGAVSIYKPGFSIQPDFDLFNASKSIAGQSNKMFLLSGGASFRYTFQLGPGGPPEGGPDDIEGEGEGDGGGRPGGLMGFLTTLSPYAEFGMGLTYADISARSIGISGKRVTYGGSFTFGTSISDRAFLQMKYRFAPKVMNIDTNSLSFEFGIRF